jgi:hypothetical protein
VYAQGPAALFVERLAGVPEAGGGLAKELEGRFGVAGGTRQVALDLVDGGVPGRLEQNHVRQQLGGFRVARGTVDVAGSRRRDRGRHDEADPAGRARLCRAVERRLGFLDSGKRRRRIRGGGDHRPVDAVEEMVGEVGVARRGKRLPEERAGIAKPAPVQGDLARRCSAIASPAGAAMSWCSRTPAARSSSAWSS